MADRRQQWISGREYDDRVRENMDKVGTMGGGVDYYYDAPETPTEVPTINVTSNNERDPVNLKSENQTFSFGEFFQDNLRTIPPECNVGHVRLNLMVGNPLPQSFLNGKFLPKGASLGVPGEAKVCAENRLLVDALKPPVVTCLFKVKGLGGLLSNMLVLRNGGLYFDNAKSNKRLACFVKNHLSVYMMSGQKKTLDEVVEFVEQKCQEHNKLFFLDDKKLQAAFRDVLKQNKELCVGGGGGIEQYSEKNRIEEWPTLFKSGCGNNHRKVDPNTGCDVKKQKEIERGTEDIHEKRMFYGLCEDALASKDETDFNMKFSAELGKKGCIGVYAKKIPKHKRHLFLTKVTKVRTKMEAQSNKVVVTKTLSSLKYKYYIICRCDAGHVASSAYKAMVKTPLKDEQSGKVVAPSLEEFASSSYYRLYMKQCLENARRLCFKFATRLTLSVYLIQSKAEIQQNKVSQEYYSNPTLRRTFFAHERVFDVALVNNAMKYQQQQNECVASNQEESVEEIEGKKGEEEEEEEDSSSEIFSLTPEVGSQHSEQQQQQQQPPRDVSTVVEEYKKSHTETNSSRFTLFQLLKDLTPPQDSQTTCPSSTDVTSSTITTTTGLTSKVVSGPCNFGEFSSCDDYDDYKTQPTASSAEEEEEEEELKGKVDCENTASQKFKYMWKTYQLPVDATVGKPVLAKEKYHQFNRTLTRMKVPVLMPTNMYSTTAVDEKVYYSSWYQIQNGSVHIRAQKCDSILMYLNSVQGYCLLKMTPEVKQHSQKPLEFNIPKVIRRSEMTQKTAEMNSMMFKDAISDDVAFFPTTLGYRGSKAYYAHLSEKEKLHYVNTIIAEEKPKTLNLSAYIRRYEKEEEEEEKEGYSSSYSSSSSRSSETTSTSSDESEDFVVDFSENRESFLANPVRASVLRVGLPKRYAMMYQGGKGSKLITPNTSYTDRDTCASNNDKRPLRSSHMIHGIELNNPKQLQLYKRYLKKISVKPTDVEQLEKILEKEHRRINPIHLIERERTLVDIPATMNELKGHLPLENAFSHVQITPICFIQSYPHCPTPLKQFKHEKMILEQEQQRYETELLLQQQQQQQQQQV